LDSLLDTNVVSQRIKVIPDARVAAWLSQIPSSELYLSAISLSEIRFGIEELPNGRRRANLENWLAHELRQGFYRHVLPVDERIAEEAGRLTSIGKQVGARPGLADALIAATARVHGLKLATLNWVHFKDLGVELVKF
jgi:predicted nucleic acid-binding protein